MFEANIRVLGGLLSSHLFATEAKYGVSLPKHEYNNELLHLAYDLAKRFLPAFNHASSGIPYARVCLALTYLFMSDR